MLFRKKDKNKKLEIFEGIQKLLGEASNEEEVLEVAKYFMTNVEVTDINFHLNTVIKKLAEYSDGQNQKVFDELGDIVGLNMLIPHVVMELSRCNEETTVTVFLKKLCLHYLDTSLDFMFTKLNHWYEAEFLHFSKEIQAFLSLVDNDTLLSKAIQYSCQSSDILTKLFKKQYYAQLLCELYWKYHQKVEFLDKVDKAIALMIHYRDDEEVVKVFRHALKTNPEQFSSVMYSYTTPADIQELLGMAQVINNENSKIRELALEAIGSSTMLLDAPQIQGVLKDLILYDSSNTIRHLAREAYKPFLKKDIQDALKSE